MKCLKIILLLLVITAPVYTATAQFNNEIHVNGLSLYKEISDLMNELELNDQQKIVIGLLILKYSLEFDYKKFEDASNTKKYTMAKAKIKELDKELKDVLDKQQFKTYKKRRKAIVKEIRKSV